MTDTLFIASTALVAAAEIGDKSQMMALLLGMRFRAPVSIIIGILGASIANHLLVGFAGQWIADTINPDVLRWGICLLFGAMAIWLAAPDRIDRSSVLKISGSSVAVAPALSFFLAELGDKSELAAATLAVRYHAVGEVVIGTTCGMMIANVPLVLFGFVAGKWIAQPFSRYIAAVAFAGMAVLTALRIDL